MEIEMQQENGTLAYEKVTKIGFSPETLELRVYFAGEDRGRRYILEDAHRINVKNIKYFYIKKKNKRGYCMLKDIPHYVIGHFENMRITAEFIEENFDRLEQIDPRAVIVVSENAGVKEPIDEIANIILSDESDKDKVAEFFL